MPSHSSVRPGSRRAAIHRRWTEHVIQYERSSLNQRAFCEQHALALSSFVRWRRRVLAEQAADGSGSDFVAVTLAPDIATSHTRTADPLTGVLRLTLPNGLRIEGVTLANIPAVAALVRAL